MARARDIAILTAALLGGCAPRSELPAKPRQPSDDGGRRQAGGPRDARASPMDAGVAPAPAARSMDAAATDSTPLPARPAGFSKLELETTGSGTRAGASRPALVHPPGTGATTEPLVVFLHGMCAIPEWECPVFVGAAKHAWLLCPPG
ncbi:MAG TPA: hypothetical protein PKA88_30840, partial [Polyangiaceae bacterium]|nr:hypothetical protein [Polyangiaceae bacterium]